MHLNDSPVNRGNITMGLKMRKIVTKLDKIVQNALSYYKGLLYVEQENILSR